MKIKSEYVLREIAGNYFAVPTGDTANYENRMITVNESGKFMWDAMQKDIALDELIDKVYSAYDADRDVIEKDVKEFVRTLKDAGLLEKV